MDTRIATQQYRLSKWASIVHDRNESGLTVKEYCLQHELSENSYFYWLKKLRSAAVESGECTFAELPAPAETATCAVDTAGVIIELNGAKIHVSNTGCRNTLAMVLEVMGHAQ